MQSAGADAVEGPDAAKIAEIAAQLTSDDVQLFYQIALLGRRDLALAPDEQSGFTMTLLRMLSYKDGASAVPKSAPAAKPIATGVSEQMSSNAASSKAFAAVPVAISAGLPFDGDWPAFIAAQNMSGMAGMLARQCEFKSFDGGVLELSVPDQHKHLAEKPYQEKLKASLAPHFGGNVKLNIKIGGAAGVSVAATEDRARSQLQADAEAAIDADPFIKNLQQDFGAEINRASIRPA